MKTINFFLLLYCLSLTTISVAQMSPCGTVLPLEAREHLRHARQQAILQPKGQYPTRYLPIQLHIVGTDAGTGYFDGAEAYRLICELNEYYLPVGFYFYLVDELRYINNTVYYDHDFDAGGDMMNENNEEGVINVYIVDNPADNCGYFSWGEDAVAIAKSCAGPGSSTLTHELGHYFFLPHTFSGWEGAFTGATLTDPPPANQQERVSGSNCATTADEFCDTPADYISYRWPCPYNGDLADPTGAQIEPDETLYMSYSSDGCQGRFSNEQITAMHETLLEYRDDLIQPEPNTELPFNTYVYYPPNGTLVVDPDHVLCTWRPVSNVEKYLLTITPSSSSAVRINMYTTDTFYVANLSNNTNYTLKVLPINQGNSCGTERKITFKTATSNMIYVNDLDMDMPNCFDTGTGSITFEAGGGTAPYSYSWSTGVQGNTDSGLASGIYYVTVTDANGSTAKIRFTLPQANQVEASASVIDNTVSITTTGGFPPYTYNWVTGANSNASQWGIPAGVYEMLVTDAVGCSTTVNYTVTTVISVPQVLGGTEIRVFPSLLSNNYTLNISVDGGNLENVQLSIINMAGAVVQQQSVGIINAPFSLSIDNALASGIYWLRIQAKQGVTTHKFVVVK